MKFREFSVLRVRLFYSPFGGRFFGESTLIFSDSITCNRKTTKVFRSSSSKGPIWQTPSSHRGLWAPSSPTHGLWRVNLAPIRLQSNTQAPRSCGSRAPTSGGHHATNIQGNVLISCSRSKRAPNKVARTDKDFRACGVVWCCPSRSSCLGQLHAR